MDDDSPCSILVPYQQPDCCPYMAEMAKAERNSVAANIGLMKHGIALFLDGAPQHHFFKVVPLVRPWKDPALQRLLLLLLEVVDKRDAEVRPEVILLLRENLEHPDEYIRGDTLRFLCRVREPELLRPIVPSVVANLLHRREFVRRHALAAVLAIHRLPPCGHMLLEYAGGGMCELVLCAVASEQEGAAVRRNAFVLLCECAQDLAVEYLLANAAHAAEWPDQLQMAALHLIRKVCRSLDDKAALGYKRIILFIAGSDCRSRPAVQYECARMLLALSSRPSSVRAAASTYCKLLLTLQQSDDDDTVQLVVLDRLQELGASHRDVMVSFAMDVLPSLANPSLDVRRKVLDLLLGLLTERNVQDVVLYLKKEAVETPESEYKQMLVQAIHGCAVEHPQVAGSVAHILVDFLGESIGATVACDVVLLVREIMETNPTLRVCMMQSLFRAFCRIQESFVCSCALWILGEYSSSVSEVETAISTVKQSLGDLPFYHPVMDSCTACHKRSDNAYATHIPATNAGISAPIAHHGSLRCLVLSGDFHLAAVVASTLTKLVLRLEEVQPSSCKVEVNKASTESLLIMVSFLQLGQSLCARHPMDPGSYNRILLCVKLLCNATANVNKLILLLSSRQSFANMLVEKALIPHAAHPDEIYHLKREFHDDDVAAAVEVADDANRLKNRLVQLTTNATCTDVAFGNMWAERGQWENKVAVNTVLTDHVEFLNRIIRSTNMTCVTPPWTPDGDQYCGFVAANLYGKSVLGDDVLMNVSVEQLADGKLGGCIRIRSKVEEMVLNLRDKILDMRKEAVNTATRPWRQVCHK